MKELITFDLTIPPVGGTDHMPFTAPEWADLGSYTHGVNVASDKYNRWADRVSARYVQNAEKVIAQVREFEQRVNHILKSNFVMMTAATQFIEYRASQLAEMKARELSREAEAKAVQAQQLAMAFENSLASVLSENESLRGEIAVMKEKLARIERANKFESVQTALGREAKKSKHKSRRMGDDF